MIKIFLIFTLFFISKASAQINEFKNKFLTARAYVEAPLYTLEIQNTLNYNKIIWKPNIRTLTGADISINNFIGAGIAWANNEDPSSNRIKGYSDYSDYHIGITLKNFRIVANYQRYKGFYLDNTAQVDPTFYSTNGINIQDRSISASNISLNTTYIFSLDKFSRAAMIDQDVRQEASGGSWLIGLASHRTEFYADNFLIPSATRSNFGEDQNIKEVQFYDLSLKGGYGYTFAINKKWFFSLLADIGFGGEFRSYTDGVTQLKKQSGGGTTIIDAAVSTGYNGDDFLAAIIVYGETTTFTTQSLKIPSGIGDAKLAIGAHF